MKRNIITTTPYPQLISVYEVIEKITRDINLKSSDEWNINWFIEWIAEAEELIGSNVGLITKETELVVENKRAYLPCDMYSLIMLSISGIGLLEDSSKFGIGQKCEYHINDTVININLQDGARINISYYAIPTDDNGFPLVKNTIFHKEAIESYVIWKFKYRDYLNGIYPPQVYKDIEMRWYNKRDIARADDNFPNAARIENIKRSWLRLIPQMDLYYKSFTNRGADSIYHRNI
jgi:hypothetical protein